MLSEKCKIQAQIQAHFQRRIKIMPATWFEQLVQLITGNENDKFCSVIVNTYIPHVAIRGSFLRL